MVPERRDERPGWTSARRIRVRRPVDYPRLARDLQGLAALYEGGWPQRQAWDELHAKAADGRIKQLALTPRARAVMALARDFHRQFEQDLAARVGHAEQVLVTAAVPADVPPALQGVHFDVADGTVVRAA